MGIAKQTSLQCYLFSNSYRLVFIHSIRGGGGGSVSAFILSVCAFLSLCMCVSVCTCEEERNRKGGGERGGGGRETDGHRWRVRDGRKNTERERESVCACHRVFVSNV